MIMIYTAFGLPVLKINSGSVKENKVNLTAYGGPKHGNEDYDRTVHELRADGGINEIHDAVNNPESYCPSQSDIEEFFNEHCK